MSQPGFDQQPQAPHVYGTQPFGQQHGPQAYDEHGLPFYFPDLEGAAYKSKATMFAIIGFFVLGFAFGPLAILNAGRAEALNVPATFGKVAGWIVTVLWFGSLILIIGAAVAGIIGANS
jgi:hypothetical protein